MVKLKWGATIHVGGFLSTRKRRERGLNEREERVGPRSVEENEVRHSDLILKISLPFSLLGGFYYWVVSFG